MNLIIDASILVGELLRRRGRAVLSGPQLNLFITEEQLSEAAYEIARRIDKIARYGNLTPTEKEELLTEAMSPLTSGIIQAIDRQTYEPSREIAERRMARDPNDWAPVALAITLGADILTNDCDFLGSGCATWTMDTLRAELDLA